MPFRHGGSEKQRFHYAHLIGKDGKIPGADFAKSGEAHGKAFWDLISSKEPLRWDYRLVRSASLGKTIERL